MNLTTLERIASDLTSACARVTLNRAVDADSDLLALSGAIQAGACTTSWGTSDLDEDAAADARSALDEMAAHVDDMRRHIDDAGWLCDDADEDEVMEYMEDQVAELETMAEEINK